MEEFEAILLDGNALNIFIFGDISQWWGYNEAILFRQLRGQDVTTINLYIKSEGGSAIRGLAIHDMLKGHKAQKNAFLMGYCYSAATHIACACDNVAMTKRCSYLIHNSSTYSYGTKEDIQKTANELATFDSIINEIYTDKTGMSTEEVAELMTMDVVLTASDALKLGFVDEIVDSVDIDFFNIPKEAPASEQEYLYFLYNSVQNKRVSDKKRMPSTIVNKFSKQSQSSFMKLKDLLPDFLNKNSLKITGKDGKEVDLATIENMEGNVEILTKDNLLEQITNLTFSPELVDKLTNAVKPTFEKVMLANSDAVATVIKNNVDPLRQEVIAIKTAKTGNGITGNGESGLETGGGVSNSSSEDYIKQNRLLYMKNMVKKGAMTKQDFKKATGEDFKA